jgi:hypothetical protein
MASGRTAFSLISLGAFLWVYGLTVISLFLGKPLLPPKGRKVIRIFLSSFFAGTYLLILILLNPLLSMECTFFIILTPAACIGSEIIDRVEVLEAEDALSRALLEALVLGGLCFAVALIREPLGFGSLSVPGGPWGFVELFSNDQDAFVPIRIISSSAGAFFLLGYGLALFRYYKNRLNESEDAE